jgi:hypothetical protein
MADVFVPDVGLEELTANAFIYGPLKQKSQYLLNLYKYQVTWSDSITIGDLDICDFTGYSEVVIDPSALVITQDFSEDWQAAYINNPVSWQNNGANQGVSGFVVQSSTTGNILWAQQFGNFILYTNQIIQVFFVMQLIV